MTPKQRQLLSKIFWDRSRELTMTSKKYKNHVKKFWHFLLKNDIGKGDATTNSLIKKNEKISAMIVAKEDGIFAGSDEIIFLNKDLEIKALKNDGDKIKKGEALLDIKGNSKKILSRERTFLNLLQRMSGIATLTNNLVKKLNDKGSKARIAATRKTLWGSLDKKAVSVGGGLTHRLSLSDGILIKDNHLKIMRGNIEKALGLAKSKSKYIEIEVENKKQAVTAAKAIKKMSNNNNFFAIMLDKVPPEEIKSIIEELKNKDLYGYVLLEASGNINSDNLTEYGNCGVDIISMGRITNSAKALNMSLEIL
jgi:nicotinate-nucleotide pyrophosphorylase (carboxylating)